MSARKTPVRLRNETFGEGVVALLRYTEKDGVLKASEKQDVTADFRGVMLQRLLPPGNEGLQPVIVKAANGQPLSEHEAELLGDFADRLGDEIVAHEEAKGAGA